MTKRPEAIAVATLLALIVGVGVLSRNNANLEQSNASNMDPSPVVASLRNTPTPPPTSTPSIQDTLQVESTNIIIPTLVPSPTSNNGIAPLAADAGQIIVPNVAPTALPSVAGFNPVPYTPPLALNPNDHFWLYRPLDSSQTNAGLEYYPFGSDGAADEFRIHHGIDIPNPTGTEILATGDGTVIWAAEGLETEFEFIGCYANVIVIEHDSGYRGEKLYTLYAHLFAILVHEGQRVRAGDSIALTGTTGCSTGPHLHFEVRVGSNGYNFARNPVLWMVPYRETGIILGRIEFESGKVVVDAPITVINLDSGRIVYNSSAYAGPGVQPDLVWNENFALGDVPAGRYLVTSYFGNTTWRGEVTVVPGATAWVEFTREFSAP